VKPEEFLEKWRHQVDITLSEGGNAWATPLVQLWRALAASQERVRELEAAAQRVLEVADNPQGLEATDAAALDDLRALLRAPAK